MTWKILKVMDIVSATYNSNEKGRGRKCCGVCKKPFQNKPYFKMEYSPYVKFHKECLIKYLEEFLERVKVAEEIFIEEEI